jgi:dipeptidyl aminopeptidase/acylaminoacyl peptidase
MVSLRHALLSASAALLLFGQAAAETSETSFLDFPMVEVVSAAKVPAFAWTVRQGDTTSLQFARGPDFHRMTLATRSDHDGQPITDASIAPDGAHIVFSTGVAAAEGALNPASLIEAPAPTLWLVGTSSAAKPKSLGVGLEPSFTPDGRRLLFKRSGGLWSLDLASDKAKPKLFAKGGGDWSQFTWTKTGHLIFVDDRRGYSFLGRYRPGADRVDWLVTGADRIAVPVLSPDGTTVAFLRLPGRKHSVTYDRTEAEPFAIDLVDLSNGGVRTVWRTKGKAVTLGMDDPEGALRWVSNDRLAFYSEDDGWGRLYALPKAGGQPQPLTPTGCDVAESEAAADQLLVIHNCGDRDTRQMSMIDPATGAERRLSQPDLVLARAASSGAYGAFVGANPEHGPLVRVIDTKSGRTVMAENYASYGYHNLLTGPPPREVHLTSLDGLRFTAQLFTPASSGKHPGLIYVHGGPQRQMFPSFHYIGYYANDYAVNRRLAEQGFAVLAVNYRSGIGYGREFRDAPGRAWRGASEYQDVLAAARWLAAQPGVNPQRIGIWGGSYGGLLTAQALARNSDLFKAGVAIHGVYDWSWPSTVKGHLNPSWYFGVGEDDKKIAKAASPLGAIEGWRSPVLLFSGDQDMNVDVVETVDLAQRLREQGVEVRTVLVPGEAHDFIRHSAWKRLWTELDAFLTEKLK